MDSHNCKGTLCATLLSLLPLSFWCAAAKAAEWQFVPRVVVTGVYNDNYLLDPDPAEKISVFGTQADAGVQIRGDTPTSSIVLWPYATGSFYPGHSDLDGDLEFLDMTLNHTGQTTKSAIDVNYSQRTLLQEILPTTDVNSDLGETSHGTNPGALEERDRQDLLFVRPSGQISLSPRSQLTFQAEYDDATYDRQIAGSYVNYDNVIGSVGWAYEVSPRGTLSFSGTGAEFSSSSEGRTQTYGLQTQWYKYVTQTAKYYLRVGVNHTEFGGGAELSGDASNSANTISAGAGASWNFQLTDVFVDLTRWVNSSPSGFSVDQNQLRFRLERRWTPRLATFAGVVGVKEDPLGSASSALAVSYLAGTLGFEWRYTRDFALVGAYTRVFQKLGDDASSAQNDMLKVSVVYQLNRPAQGAAISVPY